MAQGDRKHHKRSKRLKVPILERSFLNIILILIFYYSSLGWFQTKSCFLPRIPAKWLRKATCERYETQTVIYQKIKAQALYQS
jgi:hypothetical protein